MAKKQKKIEVKRVPTKQQLSKWEQQKKVQRIIMISGCVLFALVIALAGYGYYDSNIKPYHQKVLQVNDRIIDMNYYLDALTIFLSGVDPSQASLMADAVLSTITRNELILQRASSLGVTVTDDEIENDLREQQMPVTQLYKDIYGAEVLGERLLSTYFDPRVPITAPQVNIQTMFVESMEVADEVLGKLDENESFLQLAKRYSVENSIRESSGEIGWIMEGLATLSNGKFSNSLLDDIAFNTEPGTVSEPTFDPSVVKGGGYWILKVIERQETGSHMSGILLGSQAEANEVRSKLMAGDDFAELAKEVSQHLESKDFGGDLGWVQKGFGNEVVVRAASELPVDTLSDPLHDTSVTTKGGYWLVKTIEKDDSREIDEEIRDKLKSQAFQDWLDEQLDSSTVESYLDQQTKYWVVTRALADLEDDK